jgi:hypothetical protein
MNKRSSAIGFSLSTTRGEHGNGSRHSLVSQFIAMALLSCRLQK